MAYTFLNLRDATANQLGKADGGTANTIRDNHINDVIRGEIINAYPFSWARKTDSAIITDASGQADLPEDYNPTHQLYDVREVTSGQGNDNIYTEVPREVFDSYATGQYRYFIDYNTSTNRYRLNTTEASKTLRVVYYHIPDALSDTTDVSIVPDKDCVAYLAAARYWLSSERDETNHDRFKTLGNQRLSQMIVNDKRANPTRVKRGEVYGRNMGWNS